MKNLRSTLVFRHVWTVAEAAAHHGVSRNLIDYALRLGEIEHERRGGTILVYRPSAERWRPRSQR